MKRILIVTYYFPPHPSIGSRRWAKFAKYLNKKGYVVDVICVENSGQSSPWNQDTSGVNVFKVPFRYFRILDKQPKKIIEKLFYRLALLITGIFSKGTIYDRALFLKNQYQKTMMKLMAKNEYEAVISNGPPHRVMFYAAQMKKMFPETIFVADFRDPWTWWYNLGYPNLNEKNKKFENFMEGYVIENVDLITCPIRAMKKELSKKYPAFENKIQILPHAFDDEDFKEIQVQEKSDKENVELRMVYFGAKYKAAESEWNRVFELIKNQNGNFHLDLYLTDFEEKSIPTNNFSISVKDPISSHKLFKSIKFYDFIVLVYPAEFKDYFASKFYEMIRIKVPILYFGYKGETSEFIELNSLGLFIDMNQVGQLDDAYWKSKIASFSYDINADVSNYSFAHQTDVLIEFIQKLKK